jgi:hypothetical protein
MRESNLQKQNAFSEWTNSNPLARYSLAAFMRGTSVAHRPTLLSDRRVSCSSAKTQNGSFSFRLSDADKCRVISRSTFPKSMAHRAKAGETLRST